VLRIDPICCDRAESQDHICAEKHNRKENELKRGLDAWPK
jgi:hypothetical protein